MPLARGLGLLVTVVWLAGCRTYGGYDSEPIAYEQIQEANRVFAEELELARGNLVQITELAETTPALTDFAEQYKALVEGHAAVLQANLELQAELADEEDFRPLHRALDAVVVEHNLVRLQYQGLLANLVHPPDTVRLVKELDNLDSRYAFVPPYYERIEYANEIPTIALAVGSGVSRRQLDVPGVVPPGGEENETGGVEVEDRVTDLEQEGAAGADGEP